MRIQTIESRSRRDFHAVYVCELCGWTRRGYGYDDANFHENVIPTMVCEDCNESSGVQSSAAVIPPGIVL